VNCPLQGLVCAKTIGELEYGEQRHRLPLPDRRRSQPKSAGRNVLRAAADTAPYFHDGSVATLTDAVAMMGHHQLGIDLSPDEIESLQAWIRGNAQPALLSGDAKRLERTFQSRESHRPVNRSPHGREEPVPAPVAAARERRPPTTSQGQFSR